MQEFCIYKWEFRCFDQDLFFVGQCYTYIPEQLNLTSCDFLKISVVYCRRKVPAKVVCLNSGTKRVISWVRNILWLRDTRDILSCLTGHACKKITLLNYYVFFPPIFHNSSPRPILSAHTPPRFIRQILLQKLPYSKYICKLHFAWCFPHTTTKRESRPPQNYDNKPITISVNKSQARYRPGVAQRVQGS